MNHPDLPQIQAAAREYRQDLKALQKELGLHTEAELRRLLASSNSTVFDGIFKRE